MSSERLTFVDATNSAGIIVQAGGLTVAITPHQIRDETTVVVTPDELHGYACRFRWFPGVFGRLGQLVASVEHKG